MRLGTSMAYTRLSDANEITARYMDSLLIEERLIDSVLADTGAVLLGEKFSRLWLLVPMVLP